MQRGQDVPADVLARAVECVSSGGVLLYPTETVYGIGGDATDEEPTLRIHRLKGSDPTKPLLVLTDSWKRVEDWIRPPRGLAQDLMRISDVHPITILFPAGPLVPEFLIGASEEIGIRLSHNPFCRRLIQNAGRPISSTSANQTGGTAPYRLEDVDAGIRDGVDFAVDGGILPGVASTIVRVEHGDLQILREGSISRVALEKLLS